MSIYSIAGPGLVAPPLRASSRRRAATRGEAMMVDLKLDMMSGPGFELSARELPDYLPVATGIPELPRSCRRRGPCLQNCAHILTAIGRSLIARGSRYAAVPQALIVIAGEGPIDVAKVPPVKERTESLDRDWAEEPAFAGAPAPVGPSARTSAL